MHKESLYLLDTLKIEKYLNKFLSIADSSMSVATELFCLRAHQRN